MRTRWRGARAKLALAESLDSGSTRLTDSTPLFAVVVATTAVPRIQENNVDF